MKYLILGASGYIGSYLYQSLKKDGYDVTGTSRTMQNGQEYIQFDILRDSVDKVVMEENDDTKKIAIFCIAQSNIDRCHTDYQISYDINVVQTKEMIKKLSERKYKIIFFSTDNVFDGKEGNYTEQSTTNPLNDYGKMKVKIEKYLINEIDDFCILRLPKVLDNRINGSNLLSGLDAIKDGQVYKCIQGNILSFLGLKDLYNVLLIVVNHNLSGIFHVCGDENISRKEFVKKFLHMAHKDKVHVTECELEGIPFIDKRRPLNVSMSNEKIRKMTGYTFFSIDEMIMDYIQESIDKM